LKNLVDLRTLDADFLFDLRYASSNNFTGRRLYPERAGVWLHEDAAVALVEVQRDLKRQMLGLKIFDAYRPLQIQKIMWKAIGDERYVSDPSKEAGRHTRGTAVDVTLVHSSGYELLMPTDFDEFGELAHRQTGNHLEPAGRNCLLLERIMVLHGFNPYRFEWWHFDYIGWEKYPALDVSFESLEQHFST
jgi:zinc D-Ala-D-Ala dipeptidase